MINDVVSELIVPVIKYSQEKDGSWKMTARYDKGHVYGHHNKRRSVLVKLVADRYGPRPPEKYDFVPLDGDDPYPNRR